MSWSSTRSAAGVAVRERAHSDDAKHRTHDGATTGATRPRWLVPAVIAAVVVIVATGVMTAAAVRHHDEPGRPGAASGDPSGSPSASSAPSPASSSGIAADGSLSGRLVLTGTSVFKQLPFHGSPGLNSPSRSASMGFTCSGAACTVQDPACPHPSLTGGGGTYTSRTVTRHSSPYGPLVDTTTCLLEVSDGRATYSVSNTGAYKGKDADHHAQVDPQSSTLTGTLKVVS